MSVPSFNEFDIKYLHPFQHMKMTRKIKVLKKQLPFLIQAVNSHGMSDSLVTKLEQMCCKTEFECTCARGKDSQFSHRKRIISNHTLQISTSRLRLISHNPYDFQSSPLPDVLQLYLKCYTLVVLITSDDKIAIRHQHLLSVSNTAIRH